jgi:transposase
VIPGITSAVLRAHNGAPDNIAAACIDMSPAFIKGVTDQLPKAKITFDKFHVVAHASQAVDQMRRTEQRTDGGIASIGQRDGLALIRRSNREGTDKLRPLLQQKQRRCSYAVDRFFRVTRPSNRSWA